jgi:hypothetical protein
MIDPSGLERTLAPFPGGEKPQLSPRLAAGFTSLADEDDKSP